MTEVGLRAPLARRPRPLFFAGRAAAAEAAMTDLLDFVALSLTPCSRWRGAADRLRRGSGPKAALEFACSGPAGESGGRDAVSRLRARATAALETVGSLRAAAVPWSNPAYPPALTTIPDPPFVLWIRGIVAALSTPAVAIVGARA